MTFEEALPVSASEQEREDRYRAVRRRLASVLDDETDPVAAMATVACQLHGAFAYFDWTGFYRHIEPELLVVGPYQGPMGCLRIPFSNGICGAAARERETQWVDDVSSREDHIACSSTTNAEVVAPVPARGGGVAAVLDVDSDELAAFSETDCEHLESLAETLGRDFEMETPLE